LEGSVSRLRGPLERRPPELGLNAAVSKRRVLSMTFNFLKTKKNVRIDMAHARLTICSVEFDSPAPMDDRATT